MELALHLGGMTVRELERRMTEDELEEWQLYSRRYKLPWRRMEFYLANVAFTTARSVGSTKARSMVDFLIEFGPPAVDAPVATAEEHAEMLSGMSGKGVIVLGQKRRAREAAKRGAR